jgi:hypothetical protein
MAFHFASSLIATRTYFDLFINCRLSGREQVIKIDSPEPSFIVYLTMRSISVSTIFAGATPSSADAFLMLARQSSKLIDTLLMTSVSANAAVTVPISEKITEIDIILTRIEFPPVGLSATIRYRKFLQKQSLII